MLSVNRLMCEFWALFAWSWSAKRIVFNSLTFIHSDLSSGVQWPDVSSVSDFIPQPRSEASVKIVILGRVAFISTSRIGKPFLRRASSFHHVNSVLLSCDKEQT